MNTDTSEKQTFHQNFKNLPRELQVQIAEQYASQEFLKHGEEWNPDMIGHMLTQRDWHDYVNMLIKCQDIANFPDRIHTREIVDQFGIWKVTGSVYVQICDAHNCKTNAHLFSMSLPYIDTKTFIYALRYFFNNGFDTYTLYFSKKYMNLICDCISRLNWDNVTDEDKKLVCRVLRYDKYGENVVNFAKNMNLSFQNVLDYWAIYVLTPGLWQGNPSEEERNDFLEQNKVNIISSIIYSSQCDLFVELWDLYNADPLFMECMQLATKIYVDEIYDIYCYSSSVISTYCKKINYAYHSNVIRPLDNLNTVSRFITIMDAQFAHDNYDYFEAIMSKLVMNAIQYMHADDIQSFHSKIVDMNHSIIIINVVNSIKRLVKSNFIEYIPSYLHNTQEPSKNKYMFKIWLIYLKNMIVTSAPNLKKLYDLQLLEGNDLINCIFYTFEHIAHTNPDHSYTYVMTEIFTKYNINFILNLDLPESYKWTADQKNLHDIINFAYMHWPSNIQVKLFKFLEKHADLDFTKLLENNELDDKTLAGLIRTAKTDLTRHAFEMSQQRGHLNSLLMPFSNQSMCAYLLPILWKIPASRLMGVCNIHPHNNPCKNICKFDEVLQLADESYMPHATWQDVWRQLLSGSKASQVRLKMISPKSTCHSIMAELLIYAPTDEVLEWMKIWNECRPEDGIFEPINYITMPCLQMTKDDIGPQNYVFNIGKKSKMFRRILQRNDNELFDILVKRGTITDKSISRKNWYALRYVFSNLIKQRFNIVHPIHVNGGYSMERMKKDKNFMLAEKMLDLLGDNINRKILDKYILTVARDGKTYITGDYNNKVGHIIRSLDIEGIYLKEYLDQRYPPSIDIDNNEE